MPAGFQNRLEASFSIHVKALPIPTGRAPTSMFKNVIVDCASFLNLGFKSGKGVWADDGVQKVVKIMMLSK